MTQVRTSTVFSVFDVSTVVPTVDLGAGVVAFVTNRVGVNWDVRRFQSVGKNTADSGFSFGEQGEQHLAFWRATLAAVIRF